jgi:hypothetical protein
LNQRISAPVFVVNLTISIAICAYVFFLMPVSLLSRIVMGTMIASSIAQVWTYWSMGAKMRQLYLYIFMFHILYFITEVFVYALFTLNIVRADAQFLDNSIEANSQRWAQYDSLLGYKGIPGAFRNVKYYNDVEVYNHISHINEQGWFSIKDYKKQKRNNVKRYAVLGDSFSSGFNIPCAWPDAASSTLDSIELYNFSLEGIGVSNWHLIYFNEIVKYDFDGIIIAASNEQYGVSDMDRKLMIMHSGKEVTYIGQYDTVPSPSIFYNQLGQMTEGYALMSENRMKQVICRYNSNCEDELELPVLDLYFLRTAITVFRQLGAYFELEQDFEEYKAELVERFPDSMPMQDLKDFKRKYPASKLLQNIVDHCKQTGKEVILVSIPDLSGVRDSGLAARNTIEMQVLAKEFKVAYFNGYSCFTGMSEKDVNDHYYQHDLHWNQKGANLFSFRFSSWLGSSKRVK